MLVWIGFWELGLFGTPVWRIWLGGVFGVTGGGERPVAGAIALSLAGGIGFVWYTCLADLAEWVFWGERRERGQEKPRISKPRFALRVLFD